MSNFFIWYFSLSFLQAIEFFFKAILLMVLCLIPVLIFWGVFKFINQNKEPTVAKPNVVRNNREQALVN